jgi:hypothetical protein
VTDNRQIVLQKLAALKVPKMTGDLAALINIRKSDADFAEWRMRLGDAMSYVGEVGEDDQSLNKAAEVVSAQLSDGLSHVERATKKSPALQALKHGVTGLAITGISTATSELITGDPWVGLASGAAGSIAGKAADSALAYVKALQARGRGV